MPVIDATTAVLFAAGSVVIALILCTALRRHKFRDAGIRWLTASNLAFLIAAGGVLLSGHLGFAASAMLVIGGAYAGICFGWFAVLSVEEEATPWRSLTAWAAIIVTSQSLLALQFESVNLLMLTSSVVNSALLGYVIWRIWRLIHPRSPRLASLMCMPFALLFAGYAVRIPVVLTDPLGQGPLLATLLIIVAMAWASVILELAMIALREAKVQTALRNALDKAEAATKARTRFLLGISHDLRTPLNGILGLSELMRHEVLGCLPRAYAEQAAHIHQNGIALSELIDDLLLHTADDQDDDGPDDVLSEEVAAAVHDKFANTGHEEAQPDWLKTGS